VVESPNSTNYPAAESSSSGPSPDQILVPEWTKFRSLVIHPHHDPQIGVMRCTGRFPINPWVPTKMLLLNVHKTNLSLNFRHNVCSSNFLKTFNHHFFKFISILFFYHKRIMNRNYTYFSFKKKIL